MEYKEIEDKKQEYLKRFDEVFGTDTRKYIDVSKVPLWSVIYDRIIDDITKTSTYYNELRHKCVEALDKLQDTFSKEQKALFEVYCDIDNEQQIEMEQQIFFFGYILAKELEREDKSFI